MTPHPLIGAGPACSSGDGSPQGSARAIYGHPGLHEELPSPIYGWEATLTPQGPLRAKATGVATAEEMSTAGTLIVDDLAYPTTPQHSHNGVSM